MPMPMSLFPTPNMLKEVETPTSQVFSAALQGGFSMAGLPLSSPPSCVTEVNEGTPSVRALLPLPPTDVAQLLSQVGVVMTQSSTA